METFMFLLCFLFFTPNLNGVLLDKTTSTNNGISGHQYVALMELLTEEIKARKNIEEAVTQLHLEVVSKTLNITDLRDQTNKLELSVHQLKMENVAIHQSYSNLLHNYSTLQVDHNAVKGQLIGYEKKSTKMETEIMALKQLKAITQLQDINTLQTDTQTLKQQVHTLTTNQAARGQDFLALYNQTLAFRSDTARDIIKLSSHHNDSIDLMFSKLQNENETSHQLIGNMNKTMYVFNQQIANNVTQSSSQIKKMLHDEIHAISRQVNEEINARGTTYIIWSRKQCPTKNDTELVYSGYTGGGYTGDVGAPPEPVCLPLDPNFGKTSGEDYGRMHGAEFMTNFFASNSLNQDVPCAVCRTNKASSVIMIPGKNRCYKGWNMEYYGYLSSSSRGNKGASSYICVDIKPEYVTGGSSVNYNGQQFYEVLAKCGSLHCPPHHDNYPMTCVVCSK